MHEYEELKLKAKMGEDFETLVGLINRSIIKVETAQISGNKPSILEITHDRHDLAEVYKWLFGKSRKVPHNVSVVVKRRGSED